MYSSRPILFCAVSAFLLEFYIESFSRHSLIEGIQYLFGSPLAFICNFIILFAFMAISLPFKKGLAAWTTAFAVWFVFGTANGIVLMNRQSPFTASDFAILPSVLEIFTKYLTVFQIILIVIGLIAVITGLVFLWIKCPKREVMPKKGWIALGVTAAVTAATVHLSIVFGIVTTEYGTLLEAYYDSGFPYSFSRSVVCRGISEPNEYSKADVDEVLAELDDMDELTVEPFGNSDGQPDVIFVQLESFFDINAVKGVTLSEDPIPCFTELKQNYPTGYMKVPLIGSGTANTEFEVLTGMNIDYFSPGEYPFIAKLDDDGFACDSLARVFKEYGYTTHAMHNNTGTFYNRYKVYPNLGFDSFTPIEYMYDVEYNPLDWAKDMVLIDEIQKCLDSSEGSDLIFTVTVQPHGAYPTEQTGEYPITVSGLPDDDTERYHMFSYYVNQIKETDDFIRALTEHFSKVDKDTVIVFYGDHLPDLKMEESDLSRGDMYSTEYVIWSNYGLGNKDAAPETLEAYQLSSYVLSLFYVEGNIMNQIHTLYKDGDPERYDEVMRLIEYDALYGEKYCFRGETPQVSDIRYGNTEIAMTSHSVENGKLTVKGKGFNKYSVIYLDGKRVDTVFNANGTLSADVRKSFTHLEVLQEAPNGTVFSKK